MQTRSYDELKEELVTFMKDNGQCVFYRVPLEEVLGTDKLLHKLGALALQTKSTFELTSYGAVIFRPLTY